MMYMQVNSEIAYQFCGLCCFVNKRKFETNDKLCSGYVSVVNKETGNSLKMTCNSMVQSIILKPLNIIMLTITKPLGMYMPV